MSATNSLRRRVAYILLLGAVAGCASVCGEGKEPPGDPTQLDPIALYDQMRSYAGGDDLKLLQVSAVGVRSDGTINLEDDRFRSKAHYHWVRPTSAPPDAPPVGAGGGEKWYERVAVYLEPPGDAGEETDEHGTRRVVTKGMRRSVSEPEAGEMPKGVLPAPRCNFADLWKEAEARGAPSGAVARIDYLDGEYDFRISDTDVSLDFDPDCNIIED